jgi:uncharacterized damage-inducible protein DinB
MTANEIRELLGYHEWANNRLFDVIEKLTPEQYMRDVKSSHGSLHGTLVHLVGTEKVWLDRLRQKSNIVFLKPDDVHSFAELRSFWNAMREEWKQFIGSLTDDKLKETLTFTSSRGDVFSNTYSQMLQQFINHSTFHRGQVVTILRQLGATPVGTDMILFFDRK